MIKNVIYIKIIKKLEYLDKLIDLKGENVK